MPVFVHHLETLVPKTSYSQEWSSELMQKEMAERPAIRRIIRSLYRKSGIEKRHSVVADLEDGTSTSLFFAPDGSRLPTPSTSMRNEIYTREARILFGELAQQLLTGARGFQREDVTHVITISCTGFFAPGPDFHVVQALGLPGTIQRYHVGFMGCYAAFQGLKMAQAFCHSDPDAVVLVLAVELCSLHLQFSTETDDLIAGAVFADGAGGALVSARRPHGRAMELEAFHSELAVEGEADMAWTIGDHGFRMKLSTYVPDIIQTNLEPVMAAALGAVDLTPAEIGWWAIHPGGRAIVDRVEESLKLDEGALAASRKVLRNFGNMSSATILFVLKEMLDGGTPTFPMPQGAEVKAAVVPVALPKDGDRIFAMAFGPGLTMETGVLRVHDATATP
ncbi:MAG: type III polyketide synthase [Gemmatimonadota bacterium]